MSDRIAVMEDGEIKQCGPPEEIYEQPSGPFVAGFIGVSNLLPGPDGAQIAVRPEKIWLGEVEEGMTSMEGTVVERVYLGTTTQVIVELASGVRLVALEQNSARARADDRWEIGDRVTLGWHPEHSLVLR
jgi:spermidine/putrescine transport system ATP-binding protein